MARQAKIGPNGEMSDYMRRKLAKQGRLHEFLPPPQPVVVETEEEIRAKLFERFGVLSKLADQTVAGKNKALIISGPPGVGKSYEILRAAKKFEERGGKVGVFKGFIRPTGLYRALHDHSSKNDLLVFDDADSVFGDMISLNLLKGATELSNERRISWAAETKMMDDDGDRLPRQILYGGNIVFITNKDMQAEVERGNMLAPHFEALMSRSLYIDLGMKTKRDAIVRIKQVVESNALMAHGITASDAHDILEFIENYTEALREVSLRLVVKLGAIKRNNPDDWKTTAKITCCR